MFAGRTALFNLIYLTFDDEDLSETRGRGSRVGKISGFESGIGYGGMADKGLDLCAARARSAEQRYKR